MDRDDDTDSIELVAPIRQMDIDEKWKVDMDGDGFGCCDDCWSQDVNDCGCWVCTVDCVSFAAIRRSVRRCWWFPLPFGLAVAVVENSSGGMFDDTRDFSIIRNKVPSIYLVFGHIE